MSMIGAPHKHFNFPIHGTKCASATWPMDVPTLGEVYRELIENYGEVQLRKPVPGDTYRKMHKPLNEMDGPAFRNLPSEITVLSPARLYRSKAWRYNGRFNMSAHTEWEFEYEYEFAGRLFNSWMNLHILTPTYMPTMCVPMIRSKTPKNHAQLSLF